MKVFVCVFEGLEAAKLSLHLDNGNSTRKFRVQNLVS